MDKELLRDLRLRSRAIEKEFEAWPKCNVQYLTLAAAILSNKLSLLIIEEQEKIMITAQQIDADLQELTGDIQTLGTDLGTAYDALIAKQASGQDFTAEDTQIQSLIGAIKGFDATAQGYFTPAATTPATSGTGVTPSGSGTTPPANSSSTSGA